MSENIYAKYVRDIKTFKGVSQVWSHRWECNLRACRLCRWILSGRCKDTQAGARPCLIAGIRRKDPCWFQRAWVT